MTLEHEIAAWDGKSAADIEEIYLQYANAQTFVAELISLIAQDAAQTGATWLLKRYLEDGWPIGQTAVNQIYQHLPQQTHWEAKLHLLQCLPVLSIAPSVTKSVHHFLDTCVVDPNKFVRAWAYNGFYELARQHPQFQPEARQRLTAALQEEAASVKARIRNIFKKDAKQAKFLQS